MLNINTVAMRCRRTLATTQRPFVSKWTLDAAVGANQRPRWRPTQTNPIGPMDKFTNDMIISNRRSTVSAARDLAAVTQALAQHH